MSKLTANETIRLLLQSISQNNTEGFYRVAERYRDQFESTGETYRSLNYILKNRPKGLMTLESNSKLKGLVERQEIDIDVVYLHESTESFLNNLFIEWTNTNLLKNHNFNVRSKILLHGSTGNGKTTLAKYIAQQTELPLFQVNASVLVQSSMGATPANIYNILSEIKEPCVLFWDEFDGIATVRGKDNSQTSGSTENERMVNTLLVQLEKMNDQVIFIGATNRRESIDPAILRRFDAELLIPDPTQQQKIEYGKKLCKFHGLSEDILSLNDSSGQYWSVSYECSSQNNLAEVKKRIQQLGKLVLLHNSGVK
jgi:SpoVK/Ycf46/Vps4 family AAA+-type ATPase